MSIKIALAGNPNCGKTTLFNALTGSNQFVGNWPGVTVEKKEGGLKGHKEVKIVDLPGIYSLSPYTLEEVVARNYLIDERPDCILNIIDGTNLERNLYLTTQLVELGIPVVLAVNMMDLVRKNGDKIDTKRLAEDLGVQVYEISALKGTGIQEAAEAAVRVAKAAVKTEPRHRFSGSVEHALAHIEELLLHDMPAEQQRWFAIKLFERDEKIIAKRNLSPEQIAHIEQDIASCEQELDDDAESIITTERYTYIGSIIDDSLKKKNSNKLSVSDKIDQVVTNRFLALPIFAVVMFLVYYISMVTVGAAATDWANDGLFGDGWHLCAIGSAEAEEAGEEYSQAAGILEAFVEERGADEVAEAMDTEREDFDGSAAVAAVKAFVLTVPADAQAVMTVEDEETLATEEVTVTGAELADAAEVYAAYEGEEPDPANYGVWVPGVPVVIESALDAMQVNDVLKGLILDGIVAGVGAVLGFVPQMLVLFLFLAFLEGCGYMARIAFILDRVFRRFGLSGKSFIPFLVGMGCGVPGIMASRTIENEKDRRMTIMTTTFIPCGAKAPFYGMIAGAIFHNSPWIATSAYFMGVVSIIVSGIMLKKTRWFAGDPAPFVMELPPYHMPTAGNLLRSMWERGWSFIKKAGTIILLSTIFVWFTSYFGFADGSFGMLEEDQLDCSILATIGKCVAWIFAPLGFGTWQATVASITGLVAKENIVGTLGILYGSGDGTVYQNMAQAFTPVSAYAFMAFNLLCAPCFAAMGAIKREMNNAKWFWIAVGYQCGFAYLVSLVINQVAGLALYGHFGLFTVVAFAVIALFCYLLFRPAKTELRR